MTYAELAAKLLREAAAFYRMLGDDKDPATAERLQELGGLYDKVAALAEKDPVGRVDGDLIT